MKKRVADIVKDILVESHIAHCFTLTGGGAMHLNDAFGSADDLKCIYFLHEQGAAIAAEAYARVHNRMPVVCVTTGPGGTNTLTGVLCAWLDNIPMLVISGQVKTTATIKSTGLKLRQFGEQEYNIVDSVKPMTKYAVTVTDAYKIKYELQKAIYYANSGRRGPCWVDIPLDIQGMQVDEEQMEEFVPNEDTEFIYQEEILNVLRTSRRPVILAGSAVRTGEAYDKFLALCDRTDIPVLMAKSVADLLPVGHEKNYGNFGINGGRAGNFIVQNADVLLVLGCRLSFGQIGFNYKDFSPESIKIVVDVDEEELKKETVKIDYPVNADLKNFIQWLLERNFQPDIDSKWLAYCREVRERFPIYQDKFRFREHVNAYYFAKLLQKYMPEDDLCIVGNSCSSVAIKQCGIAYPKQRMWGNINCGTMGYDIPAAIGAAIAADKEVVCCAGDGSFQLNIQELQVIVNYNLPIKIFVFNNGGYRSIVISQSKNFGRLSGCTDESGLTLPQLEGIANAYGIPYERCESNDELEKILEGIFHRKGCVICEIIEDEEQAIEPKLGNKVLDNGQIVSPSLIDLYPPLDSETFQRYEKFDNYVKEGGDEL
ncbi:MAG: thiamine pyrophosphate-binding protein [Lachnospiraceae bacterium]|nr:thiamine pyrophosphate-binding protein [Lachnospiraceae bacterium]